MSGRAISKEVEIPAAEICQYAVYPARGRFQVLECVDSPSLDERGFIQKTTSRPVWGSTQFRYRIVRAFHFASQARDFANALNALNNLPLLPDPLK